MKPQHDINVTVVKPSNHDELKIQYTEAVFKIIKNRVPPCLIGELIEKLKMEISSQEISFRSDSYESSSNL